MMIQQIINLQFTIINYLLKSFNCIVRY